MIGWYSTVFVTHGLTYLSQALGIYQDQKIDHNPLYYCNGIIMVGIDI